MTKFMDEDFLLSNDIAKELFAAVKDEPIIDFHNHLNPREIYEDRCFDNMAEVWLGGDHYKWRAMRANGISEKLITGDGAPFDKFVAWADTVQNLIGNPLYHWAHLELRKYFGYNGILNEKTAEEVYFLISFQVRQRMFYFHHTAKVFLNSSLLLLLEWIFEEDT